MIDVRNSELLTRYKTELTNLKNEPYQSSVWQ